MLVPLTLGLVGSLHCVAMCGPLILAVPVVGNSRRAVWSSRFVYHLGRIALYALIGAASGILGQTVAWAGFQQWLSIAAGTLMLAALFLFKSSITNSAFKLVAGLKGTFAGFIHQRNYHSLLALGAINGLLPCGLIYVAAAGAAATGTILGGVEFMAAFGLGTLPALIAVSFGARALNTRFNLQRLVPYSVAVISVLLILRGLSLGIPYLSPDLSSGTATCAACHSL